jgi:hypothetical protein
VVSEPSVVCARGKWGRQVDDATVMEDAGSNPLRRGRGLESGDRMVRLADELDDCLQSLRGSFDDLDSARLRELAFGLSAAAREEFGDEFEGAFIGLDEDGLPEEMELASLHDRLEDLISFCRASIEDTREGRE